MLRPLAQLAHQRGPLPACFARGIGRLRAALDHMNRTVKVTEAQFWEAFSSFCPPGGFFDGQGAAQRDINLRLAEAIDALLVPKLGRWQESEKWRHQLDVYRDGIHSLEFSGASFDPEFVPLLQRLLVGEHEIFCILCQVLPSLGGSRESRIGSVAIRSNRLLVSYPLVKYLKGQV